MKFYFEKLRNYYRELIVFGICLYGLYLRMAWRAGNELWHDEKWQIIYMHLPFVDFIIKIRLNLSLNDNVYSRKD